VLHLHLMNLGRLGQGGGDADQTVVGACRQGQVAAPGLGAVGGGAAPGVGDLDRAGRDSGVLGGFGRFFGGLAAGGEGQGGGRQGGQGEQTFHVEAPYQEAA